MLLWCAQAGLRAVGIVDVVEDVHQWIDTGEVWRKMTFLVKIAGDGEVNGNGEPVVKLDPNEHEAFAWVTEHEVMEDKCGERVLAWTSVEQKITILDTFKLLRSGERNDRGGNASVAIDATRDIKH